MLHCSACTHRDVVHCNRVRPGSFGQLSSQRRCNAAQIRMTADHYALVSNSRDASFVARAATPAAAVRPGHFVWRPHAVKAFAEPELVTKVDTVSGTGISIPCQSPYNRR